MKITTYTHTYFGSGFKLVKLSEEGWANLIKEQEDGSISYVADWFDNLTKDEN